MTQEKDYSYLEGMEVDWVSVSGKETHKGFIVGADKDIGITIVRADDKKRDLTCLDGPSTKIWERDAENGHYKTYHEKYDDVFANAVSMIEQGVFYCAKNLELYKKGTSIGCSMQECSFV